MSHDFLIFISMIAVIIAIAPMILSWRLSKLGTAVTDKIDGGKRPVFSSWSTVKSDGMFTKQSILSKIKIYDNGMIGLRPLWGKERFFHLEKISSAKRMLKGAKTTGIKLVSKDEEHLSTVTISGIAEAPKFIDAISRFNIETIEVADNSGILDLVR